MQTHINRKFLSCLRKNKSEDDHSSSRYQANCCHSHQQAPHSRHCSSSQTATGSGRQPTTCHRKPIPCLHTVVFLKVSEFYRGDFPLCAAYAAHSPRFLPDPESRGRPPQFALPGEVLPFSPASPAFPPLFKFANRHGQRTPADDAP